jgi:hypothetical protein
MDGAHFDRLTRSISVDASRRVLLQFAAAMLGLAPLLPKASVAKKDKKKKKKLRFNEFGCVNVGGKCRGNSDNCCSGICQGKKPKKGKKDKSRCVGHDEGTCLPGQTPTSCGGSESIACVAGGGADGQCFTTTGNAAYCSDEGDCFPCKKDADCIGVCGAGAACVRCAAACAETGGTACLGATPNSCSI